MLIVETKTSDNNASNSRKLDFSELHPLRPLDTHNFLHNYKNAELASSKDEEDEEFYSPKGFLNGRESSIGTGSVSRSAFVAVEVGNFNGSTSNSLSTYSSLVMCGIIVARAHILTTSRAAASVYFISLSCSAAITASDTVIGFPNLRTPNDRNRTSGPNIRVYLPNYNSVRIISALFWEPNPNPLSDPPIGLSPHLPTHKILTFR
ncbi:Formin-like protein [Abeliophyllum distichum]|uniref:Formin-like protein n=1 Tax=Abeliophyllum distichum TaxID=126358 RepID=A0ABD1UEQ5_9LAMI